MHIIPVKNEEGLVMMFILNFDYVLDEESGDSTEKLNNTSPTKSDQSECFFTCVCLCACVPRVLTRILYVCVIFQ